jgi:hypothetical protein
VVRILSGAPEYEDPIALMLPLKETTIWNRRIQDSEENTIAARVEKDVIISENDERGPDAIKRTIEITSPCEDRYGRRERKRFKVAVDAAALGELVEALDRISSIKWSPKTLGPTTSQLRFEGAGGLVVMFEHSANGEDRYVIGNGKRVRFICDDSSTLRELFWGLDTYGK